MIFLDCETIGLHGFMVLLQYAEDDGDIVLCNIWKESVGDTLDLIESIFEKELCFFNAAFDVFHLYKVWSTFSLLRDQEGPEFIPEDDINLVAELEEKARDYPFCIRPKAVCDLMLHARKGKYQSLMRRKPIVIRRIPTQLARMVQQELEKRIQFDDVYFSQRSKPNSERWVIKDIENPNGSINPAFKNIELEFQPSTSLKTLAKYALDIKDDFILKFADINLPNKAMPKEVGYAPFARAIGKPGRWNKAWPEVARVHIDHWAYNKLARVYASNDVKYTRQLYSYLGSPEAGDTDSELACMVGLVRWRGYEINIENLRKLRNEEKRKTLEIPTAPNAVKIYLAEVMNDNEKAVLTATKEEVLKVITDWESNPEAAKRAQEVIDARHANKEIELYDKLIKAGKFHASFKVIGALSSRMSGTDDLNPQGIRATRKVRNNFILKRPGFILCGGDFDAFEVSIAETVYNDENLRKDILSGKSPHGLFACELYPDMTYDKIVATKKTDDDKYTEGKTAFFRLMYGGGWEGMVEKLNIAPETAEKAFNNFLKRYPGIAKYLATIHNDYCSMTQPGGIGSAVVWKNPKEWVDNGLGFKRYFTLENYICKELFELGQAPPKNWKYIKTKVVRKDRPQTASGAAQSALYAAAFNIQAKCLRAAANHQIQSKGATITKELQCRLWDLQPIGMSPWIVQPMNIHDQVLCPIAPESVDKATELVESFIEEYKDVVPLLGMDWKTHMDSWAKE